MPQEVRLWEIGDGDEVAECTLASLNLESRLEVWLERDISVLSADLLVIGRQLETGYSGYIDLLCIDRSADLVIVELKRDKTPREITAQTLDYASWVKDLSRDAVVNIAKDYFKNGLSLEDAFKRRFGEDLPDTVNESHHMLIVASKIDASSERIIKYLSDSYGVSINAVTFHYFKTDKGKEFVGRVFLINPEEVEYKAGTKGSSKKRRPPLSYEELEQLAAQNDVGDLYRRLVTGLQDHFRMGTTLSSITCNGTFDKSKKCVMSLLPGDSDREHGLRFLIFLERFKKLFGLDEAQAISMIPPQREAWRYQESGGDDWAGFKGYFSNADEIDRFLNGLAAKNAVT
jgi:hypothetical protein